MIIKLKMDINGNKRASVQGTDLRRGYSIQTNGNLPKIHRLSPGGHELTPEELAELAAYRKGRL